MSRAREFADLAGSADAGGLTGRNLIINGAMQVAQRGTSFSPSGTAYSLDRWEVYTGNVNCTVTQEAFTVGQTDVPNNPTHYLNIAKNGETEVFQVRQKLEDVRILSGETVTLSFWANTSSTIALDIFQNFGSGGSTQQQRLNAGSFTIVETNGSWSKYQITNTQSNVSGKTIGAGSYTLFRIVEPSSSTNNFSVTQVQLERGDTATPFEHRSYGDELARCQRYYLRLQNDGVSLGYFGSAYNGATSIAYAMVTFPVPMRIRPTALEQSGTAAHYRIVQGTGASVALSSVPSFNSFTSPTNGGVICVTGSGLTSASGSYLTQNNAAAYLGWSAEL